jgi:hypothetical protein
MIVSVIGLTFTAYAAQPVPSEKKYNTETIEINLLSGLDSGNEGVQTSAAFFLGEMKSEKAVIPLMRLLHSSASEEARIVAAVSLYKIGDARGLYAIKENGRFDESELVRRLCDSFYKTHQLENQNK